MLSKKEMAASLLSGVSFLGGMYMFMAVDTNDISPAIGAILMMIAIAFFIIITAFLMFKMRPSQSNIKSKLKGTKYENFSSEQLAEELLSEYGSTSDIKK